MRLKPVEKPTTLMGRMDYWMSKRETGKVISPLSVVYARVPTSLRLVHEMSKLAEKGLSLDPELRFLIQHYVARLNGCGFCIDIGEAMAQRADAASRLPRVADFETDETFTDAERAALAVHWRRRGLSRHRLPLQRGGRRRSDLRVGRQCGAERWRERQRV